MISDQIYGGYVLYYYNILDTDLYHSKYDVIIIIYRFG